jgi:probable rRNA maturation factor
MSESSLHVDLDIRTNIERVVSDAEAFVSRILGAAARKLDVSGEVSVSLVDDAEIHRLNREFRNVDRPTDVLSFSQLEGEYLPVEVLPLPLLGDIILSVETAVRQAESYHHSVQRELAFLLVHGFLHLIGYDHQDEISEQEMFGIQEEVLEELGITRDFGG